MLPEQADKKAAVQEVVHQPAETMKDAAADTATF